MPPKDQEYSLTKLLLEKLQENQKQEDARHEAMVEALRSITVQLSCLTVQLPPPPDPPDPNYLYDKTTNSPPLPHITLTTTPFNLFPYIHNKAWTPNQQYYPYQQPHQVQISTLENKTQMALLQNPNTESETNDPNSIINSEKEISELMSQILEVFNIGESFSTANTTVIAENRGENSAPNEQSKIEQIATTHKWTRSPSNASPIKVPYTRNDNIAVGRGGRQESTAKRLEPSPEKKFQRALKPIRGKESGLVANRKINIGVQRDSSKCSGQRPRSLLRIRKVGGTTMVCGESGGNEITRANDESKNKEEYGNKEEEIFETNVKVVDLERKKLLKEKYEGVLRVASNMEEQNILMKNKREVGETAMMRETLEKNEMNMVGLQNRKASLIQVILAQVASSPSFDALNRSGPLDTVGQTFPFFKGLWSGPLSINDPVKFPIHLINPSMILVAVAQESFFNNSDTPKSLPMDDKKQMQLVSSPPSAWKAKAPQLSPNSHPIFSIPMAHDESNVTKFVSDYIIKKSHFSNLEDKVDFKGVGNDRILNIIFIMRFIRKGVG